MGRYRGVRPVSGLSSRTAEVPYERPAPRKQAGYRCDRGHVFEVTFAAAAEPPGVWECRCGALAAASQSTAGTARESEHDRRMAQVFQRRSIAELEELLAERLAELPTLRVHAR